MKLRCLEVFAVSFMCRSHFRGDRKSPTFKNDILKNREIKGKGERREETKVEGSEGKE